MIKSFIKKKLKDDLLRHSGVMFMASIVGGLFNFLFQIYANHNLSPDDFALFYSLATLSLMIGILGMTGLTMVAKQVSHYKTNNETGKIAYLFTHMLGKTSLLVFFGFIIYLPFTQKIASFFNRPDANLAVIITGILLAISLIAPIAYGLLQGLEKFNQWSLSMILFSLLRLLSGILLVYLGFKVTGAISSSLVAYVIVFIMILYWMRKLIFREEKPVQVSLIDFYKTSWWILGAFLFGNVICFIDILLVQHFLQSGSAQYSSASMLGRAIFYLPWALGASMFPKVSALAAQNKPTMHLLKKTLSFSFILCSSAAIIIFVMSRFIISLLLDKVYLETVPGLLRMFVFALIPYALITILVYYNIAMHRVKVVGVLLLQAVFYVTLLALFHSSLKQVIFVLGLSGIIIFISLLIFTLKADNKFQKT